MSETALWQMKGINSNSWSVCYYANNYVVILHSINTSALSFCLSHFVYTDDEIQQTCCVQM
jgi:hypothetical protein